MKTRPPLLLCFVFYTALLLSPPPVKSAALLSPLRISDTIEVYLFQQLCAGETLHGLVWQQDTVVTFFRPGNNGTDTLQTVELDVIPRPMVVLAGDSLFCQGDSAMLSVAGFFSSYQWSNAASLSSVSVSMPGIYSVTVTASNGCTGTNATTVSVSMPDFVTEFQYPGCMGADDGFIAISNFSGGQAPYEVSLNGGPFQTDSIFAPLAAGDYLLALHDAAGCTDSLRLTLTEPPPFTVDVGPDLFLTPGDTVRLSGLATDSVTTWNWQPASLFDCTGCPQPLVVHPTASTVSLTVVNAAGCIASDELVLNYDGEIRLFVPNIFSPNEDGENDFLTVFPARGNWEVKSFLLFDRWGSVVFEVEIPFHYPQTLEWDGRSGGKLLLPGVYGWVARLHLPDGSEEVRSGDVTIVR